MNRGELDEGANGEGADVVGVPEVVSQVELVDVEGDNELGCCGGKAGRSEEGDCEGWSIAELVGGVSRDMKVLEA